MNMICFISCLLALFLGYPKGMVAQGDDVAGKPRVVCYTRSGIPPKLGNALHLGYSEDGQNYMALNNDACIMALRKVDNEPGLSEEQKNTRGNEDIDKPLFVPNERQWVRCSGIAYR